MFISLEWLSQHVDLSGLNSRDIAHRLTMSTAEVEGVEEINRAVDGLIVGQIVSAEEIPGYPGLKRVEVECGTKTFASVCAAPNARAGLKSAFAPPGATIASRRIIEASEVAGVRSEGILCSAMEMGLSEFHENIFEIPPGVENGTPLSELIPPTDTLIDIDNKSLTHRPDLWGHYGLARELAAIYGRDLKPLDLEDLAQYDGLPAYPLQVDDFENCPCYCCVDLEGIVPAPAPLFIQWRLHALGQRTFDLLVDLTNYIMLELGQPMHAFDGDKLKAVRVAPMGRDGAFTTLDGAERKMLAEDLMIWNEEKPVAVAGVMGGLETEVSPETTRLMLESANFKGSRIRRTAVRLGLRSDASQRFEKNQPPVNTRVAVARFLDLARRAGQTPNVRSRLTQAGDLRDTVRDIEIPLEFFHRRIGMEIPEQKMLAILHSLGFEAAVVDARRMRVGIPPHRSAYDISIPQDIIEEVSRVYGYDNVEPRMPEIEMQTPVLNDQLRSEHKARRLLAASHGFVEVHSYSWFNDTWLKAIGYDPGKTLVVANPGAEGQGRMRTTLVPNLLANVKLNLAHQEAFRLFELGRVFQPKGEDGCHETTRLAGVSYSSVKGLDLEDHYRAIKGAVEDLALAVAGAAPTFEPGEEAPTPWHIPGQYLSVRLDGNEIGALGFLSGPLLDELNPKSQVVWFEFDFAPLEGPVYPQVQYQPPSPYPGSWFDVSIVHDAAQGYAPLAAKLDRYTHELVTKRAFLGLYKGKGLEKGMASYTFRYWIGAKDHTLSGEEIEAVQKEFFAFLESEGLALR
jgi:phenylalanyl-tRNA synthetase beta chain